MRGVNDQNAPVAVLHSGGSPELGIASALGASATDVDKGLDQENQRGCTDQAD
jgi:hypothetical protein